MWLMHVIIRLHREISLPASSHNDKAVLGLEAESTYVREALLNDVSTTVSSKH